MRIFSPVGPVQINVGYNPFPRPAGQLYYIEAANTAGFSPLYCVSPGNGIPATSGANVVHEQQAGRDCPASFVPPQTTRFVDHLKLSFSIGPDF